jgi:hypothetical protein
MNVMMRIRPHSRLIAPRGAEGADRLPAAAAEARQQQPGDVRTGDEGEQRHRGPEAKAGRTGPNIYPRTGSRPPRAPAYGGGSIEARLEPRGKPREGPT